MPPTTQKSTGLKSAGKKPAAKKTRGPRVMLFDFDHGPDTDSSDDGEDARDEGGDSDTAVEPSDEEGDGSSSEEASAKVKTKFWCAYKGCRNPPMVKQSFRRHLEMHLANDNKMRTPKCLNRCGRRRGCTCTCSADPDAQDARVRRRLAAVNEGRAHDDQRAARQGPSEDEEDPGGDSVACEDGRGRGNGVFAHEVRGGAIAEGGWDLKPTRH
ncbi:hypothetical protein PF002_g22335 [Phytophthora fragariae]|uniref:Uncharacterized protein n=1 Tax=Phytophthora fragariae TaxID=53985 RepID=A0A6A3XB78_9STRA|nr:hypothetical protein PF002_g22335 [Phytophthora fragariae]